MSVPVGRMDVNEIEKLNRLTVGTSSDRNLPTLTDMHLDSDDESSDLGRLSYICWCTLLLSAWWADRTILCIDKPTCSPLVHRSVKSRTGLVNFPSASFLKSYLEWPLTSNFTYILSKTRCSYGIHSLLKRADARGIADIIFCMRHILLHCNLVIILVSRVLIQL